MIFILEQIDQTGLQTGFIVDCADWLQMRTGWEIKIKTLTLIADIDWELDKIRCTDVSSGWFQEQCKTKEPRWSEEQHELGWQPMHVDFKPPKSDYKNLCIFIVYVIIDSCVIWLNKKS